MSQSKYRRLYKFYPPDTGLLNLTSRRLKVTTLDDINDPFEWLPFDLRKPEDRQRWQAFRRKMWKNKGVICFTEQWSHPLMWSHYASYHKGLALGFDVSEEVVEKINYVEKRTTIKDLLHYSKTFDDDEFKRHLFSKFVGWSYENEWRSTIKLEAKDPKTSLYFKDFDQEMKLKEVIIGAMSEISSDDIRQTGGIDDRVKIITARLAFKDFRVVRQRKLALQK